MRTVEGAKRSRANVSGDSPTRTQHVYLTAADVVTLPDISTCTDGFLDANGYARDYVLPKPNLRSPNYAYERVGRDTQ